MHFLSHYYTESPDSHPLFVTGLLIPDLIKGFSKTYNSVIKKSEIPMDGSLNQIHRGILQHYEADKKFHNSPLFMQQVSDVLQSFITSGLDRGTLRLSVIAHLATEIMIDRHIVVDDENVCAEFYSTIHQADEAVLRTYLSLFTPVTQERIFLTNFLLFKQKRFLFSLKNAESVVYALNRIYSSVAGVEFKDDEKMKFLTAISNIDIELRYRWKEILKR